MNRTRLYNFPAARSLGFRAETSLQGKGAEVVGEKPYVFSPGVGKVRGRGGEPGEMLGEKKRAPPNKVPHVYRKSFPRRMAPRAPKT